MDTASLSKSYRRDGLIRSLDILNDDEVQSIKLKLQAFISHHQPNPDFSNWVYSKSYLALRWVADLAFHPCIVDHVAALIGDDILLWDASIPLKSPKSKGYFGWHQDATYWPLEPADEMLAVWLAISDVSLKNGGMRAIPGSHTQGQRPHTATRHTASMLRRGQRIDDKIDDLHYYTRFIKFGIGRATDDASQEIRNNHLNRDEGKALVERFDGEFPDRYFSEIMDYINLDENLFFKLCDDFRSPHLWKKVGSEWKLRHNVNNNGTDDL